MELLGVVEREMLETVGIERSENALEFKKEEGGRLAGMEEYEEAFVCRRQGNGNVGGVQTRA